SPVRFAAQPFALHRRMDRPGDQTVSRRALYLYTTCRLCAQPNRSLYLEEIQTTFRGRLTMAGAVMARPLILDFDGSVAPLDGADSVPLQERQELIRFGCRKRELDALARDLEPILESQPPLVFLGSGDFHHVSYMLVERLRRPIQVVVFDNHPDNMRYPFGIHCGSWVGHVARLPFVARVHVLGIASSDVEGAHVIENHLAPLRSGKVVYWCVRRNLRALGRFGVRHSHSFASVSEMLDRFSAAIAPEPVYLSIDKDVLARDVVETNWDQGVMTLEEIESAIGLVRGRLI